MTTNAQRQVLANVALRDLHPQWIPSLEPLQLASAMGSPWGRRWLARQLSNEFLLFDDRWQCPGNFIELDGWVYLPSSLWSAWLSGLGALSMGLSYRSDRDSCPGYSSSGAVVPQWNRYFTDSDRIPAKKAGLSIVNETNLRMEGVRQLHHHAIGIHPFAAERVRLAFAPDVTRSAPGRVLATARIRSFIQSVMSGTSGSQAEKRCQQSETTLIPNG